jgi:hypothetical protein
MEFMTPNNYFVQHVCDSSILVRFALHSENLLDVDFDPNVIDLSLEFDSKERAFHSQYTFYSKTHNPSTF